MPYKQYFVNAGIRQHLVVNRIEAMKNANGMREMTVDGWFAELGTRLRASVEQSLLADCLPCLSRPLPVSNFFFVDPFGVCIVNARDDLTLQPFLDVSTDGTQTWDKIDDVNCQIETVDLIENRKFERSVDAALFLVPVYMYVVVILAPVTKFVNERSIGMEVEDDRLVGGEE
jgi:hypothetical protein